MKWTPVPTESRPKLRLYLLFSCLLVAVSAVLFVAKSVAGGRPGALAGRSESSEIAARSVQELPRGMRIEVESEEGEVGAPSPASTHAGDLAVTVEALDLLAGVPVVGADLSIRGMGTSDAGTEWSEHGVTGQGGQAVFHLDGARWSLGDNCHVTLTGASKLPLFEATVRLQRHMVLLTRSMIELRGRVTTSPHDLPRLSHVAAYSPLGFVARSQIREGGRFALRGYVDEVPGAFSLVFSVKNGPTVWQQDVPTELLTSPDGAFLHIVFGSFECLVLDEEGRTLSEADVRLISWRGDRTIAMTATTDVEGRLHLPVPRAPLDVCAGKEGYSSTYVSRVDPASPLVLRLCRLSDEDLIFGEVVFPDGEPVPGAFVSADPVVGDDELAMAGFASNYADDEGRFALRVASDRPLRIRAFKRFFGLSEEVRIEPGGGPIRLILERRGVLKVWLETPGTWASPLRSGPLRFIVVDVASGATEKGTTYALPITVEELRSAVYNVYVQDSARGLYGEGSAVVEGGGTAEVRISAEPITWIEGQIVDSAGRPARGLGVRAVRPDWAGEVSKTWGKDRTDPEGRFRVMSGSRDRCEVEVRSGGIPVATFEVEAGLQTSLRLPPGAQAHD